MLDLEQCKQLAACGFPQEYKLPLHYWSPSTTDIATAEWHVTYGDPWLPEHNYACPNSDELLHALQARWPEYNYHLGGGHDFTMWSAVARVFGRTVDIAGAEGDTPAAALASLYVHLAQPQAQAEK
jgi:hypothetical protein